MKWYVLTLFLVVGLVLSASAQQAQQMDPKLVGTWESNDLSCNPCTLTIQENGQVSFTLAGSSVQIVFSQGTPAPGIDLTFQRGGRATLTLSRDNVLAGFYSPPNRAQTFDIVVFHRR